jgi:hypothetical protein
VKILLIDIIKAQSLLLIACRCLVQPTTLKTIRIVPGDMLQFPLCGGKRVVEISADLGSGTNRCPSALQHLLTQNDNSN